jgi:hypothetical protein
MIPSRDESSASYGTLTVGGVSQRLRFDHHGQDPLANARTEEKRGAQNERDVR